MCALTALRAVRGPEGPKKKGSPMRCLIFVVLAAGLLSGCSGRLVCQWETEDERFQELIRQTIEAAKDET